MSSAKITRVNKGAKAAVALTLAIILCCSLCSCGNSHYSTGTEKPTSSTITNKGPSSRAPSWSTYSQPKTNRYVDPRWPTTNQELLAIPEEQRWYNAWGSVETTCTIVGPVVDVYQATNEYGMPIFVTIGVDYPDPNSVTLVIWADNEADFDSMLHEIDHGNAWIAVTSYLTTYNGYLQFSSDNYVQWTYWTGVS